MAVAAAGRAPSPGGVEGEMMGIEFLEGLPGDRGDAGGREGDEFGAFVIREDAEGALAILQGGGEGLADPGLALPA